MPPTGTAAHVRAREVRARRLGPRRATHRRPPPRAPRAANATARREVAAGENSARARPRVHAADATSASVTQRAYRRERDSSPRSVAGCTGASERTPHFGRSMHLVPPLQRAGSAMSRILLALALPLGAIVLSGCYGHTRVRGSGAVMVHHPPPPPRARVTVSARSPAPYADAVWVQGHWEHSAGRYVWVRGHWVRPRAGHVYVQPRWVRRGNGWVYVGGTWTPARVRIGNRNRGTVRVRTPRGNRTEVRVRDRGSVRVRGRGSVEVR